MYVSSTISDLAPYRAAVVDVLLRFHLQPILVENLSASAVSPIEATLAALDSADIVILLLAYRLGFTAEGSDTGIVEQEYERTVERGIPLLPFIVDERQPWPPEKIDDLRGAEAGAARLRPGSRAAYLVASSMASRRLHFATRFCERHGGNRRAAPASARGTGRTA